jgi:hypothetical protein
MAYIPDDIATIMRGRTILTICSDLMSIVRGQTDGSLEVAMDLMRVIDHYRNKWDHTKSDEYDRMVWQMILVATHFGNEYVASRQFPDFNKAKDRACIRDNLRNAGEGIIDDAVKMIDWYEDKIESLERELLDEQAKLDRQQRDREDLLAELKRYGKEFVENKPSPLRP